MSEAVIDLGPLTLQQVRRNYDLEDIIAEKLTYQADRLGPLAGIVGASSETIRVPLWHTTSLRRWDMWGNDEFTDVRGFHQDCGGTEMWMLLWSNLKPTEVLTDDGEQFNLPPNRVMLISNLVAKHRIPQLTAHQSARRYFIRAVRKGKKAPTKTQLESMRQQIAAL